MGKSKKVFSIIVVYLLISALTFPIISGARAGGGGGSSSSSSSHSYSSSGSSGFYRDSNSSSSSDSSPLLIIPVLIFFVGMFGFAAYRNVKNGKKPFEGFVNNNGENSLNVGNVLGTLFGTNGTNNLSGNSVLAPVDFGPLRAVDAGFDENMFQGKIRQIFMGIQQCWINRDMRPVAHLLESNQLQTLQQQLDQLRREGHINVLENIMVERVDYIEFSQTGDFDVIKARITASCIDYRIDENTHQIINPNAYGDGKTMGRFQENWTFIRKRGVASKNNQVTACPNCGAPVTYGNVQCEYCSALMNDPQYDWVLMQIEQVR